MNKLEQLWNRLRSSLWFAPGLMVAGSVIIAVALIEIDANLDTDLSATWPRLFGAGADGARGMRTAIAGSMITVAGVTFSITIVALSLASSQYTPRILRNFMGDRTTQIVLGFFVSIFAYCLVVLRTIRGGDEGRFIPSLAVAFGFVLALVGIGVLILFIHHIASSIQASSVISSAADETLSAVRKLFPAEIGQAADRVDEDEASDLLPDEQWKIVPALRTGYIQSMDTKAILAFAEKYDAVICMEQSIGEFVVANSPLASIAIAKLPDENLIKELNSKYTINRRRTVEQDASFGITQIVDIALKALSPGINDTTTALTCIDYLGAILAELADRQIVTRYRAAGDTLRVIARGPTFPQLVAASFDQIRLCAEGNVEVLSRLIDAIATVAGRTKTRRRQQILRQHVQLIMDAANKTIETPYDRIQVLERIERAQTILNEKSPKALSERA